MCDRNTFCAGTTPGQLLANRLPYCIKKCGPKIYVLDADYNFGHISAKWPHALAKDNGGEVIQADFFPLNVSQFGPVISKTQTAKPDFVVNTFVGPAHAAFYGQWAAAGMKKEIPIASQTFGEAGEHLCMPKEVSEGTTDLLCAYARIGECRDPAFPRRVHEEASGKVWLSRRPRRIVVSGLASVGRGGAQGGFFRPNEGGSRRSKTASHSTGLAARL